MSAKERLSMVWLRMKRPSVHSAFGEEKENWVNSAIFRGEDGGGGRCQVLELEVGIFGFQ